MSDLRFVEKLANAPWLCDATYLEFMHGLVVQHGVRAAAGVPLDRRAIEQATGRPLDNTRAVTIRDGVARIPVDGPIFRHANIFTEISGAVSTGTLTKDFLSAHNDATVHSILFVFDTPGGEATGVNELAGIIRQKRDEGTKRIESYVDGLCASAGYWLASATSSITTDATGALGSIGVVTRVSNPESAGRSGTLEFWNSRSPKKRMDPKSYEGQSAIQGYVDDLGDEFIRAVADNRGVSEEEVVKDFGEGFVLTGRRAVAVGLADALGSEEGVLASLVARERDPTFADERQGERTGLSVGQIPTPITINEERLWAFANGDKEAAMTEAADKRPETAAEKPEEAVGLFRRLGAALGFAVVDVSAQDAEPPTARAREDPENQSKDDARQNASGESTETNNDAGEENEDPMTETRTSEAKARDTDERSDATTEASESSAEAGVTQTTALSADEKEELARLRADREVERTKNARLSATLRERGVSAMLDARGSNIDLGDGKRGAMPKPQREAAETLISELAAAGTDPIQLSASGDVTLADTPAGQALGSLLTHWKPQELGERGAATGDSLVDSEDGETPEGQIRALMDKEGITYREAAVRLSSKEVE